MNLPWSKCQVNLNNVVSLGKWQIPCVTYEPVIGFGGYKTRRGWASQALPLQKSEGVQEMFIGKYVSTAFST